MGLKRKNPVAMQVIHATIISNCVFRPNFSIFKNAGRKGSETRPKAIAHITLPTEVPNKLALPAKYQTLPIACISSIMSHPAICMPFIREK